MNATYLESAFVLGLFSGAVHCLPMCGGIVGTLAAAASPRGVASTPAPSDVEGDGPLLPSQALIKPKRVPSRASFVVAYNAGRVITYAAQGALAGVLGGASTSLLPYRGAQLAVRVVAGLVMVSAGLYLAGVLQAFARLEHLGRPLFRRLDPLIRRAGGVRTLRRAVLLGLLWGFLPCGLVYAGLALALASGGALEGGATMLAFGGGTLPLLLLAGGAAEFVRRLSREPGVRRAAGALIAVSGSVHLLMAAMSAGLLPNHVGAAQPPCCAGAPATHDPATHDAHRLRPATDP